MAILIPSEVPCFLSDLNANDAQLRVLLSQAESIATGASGSRRPLDLQQRTESITVSAVGAAQLKHWPVDLTQPVTLELKQFSPRNGIGSSDWVAVDSDAYEVDSKGRLFFAGVEAFAGDGFGRSGSGLRQSRRPLRSRSRVEARVNYWAGFDFRLPIPEDWELLSSGDASRIMFEQIVSLKSAIIGIVSAKIANNQILASAGSVGDNIKRVEVDNEYKIEYANSKDSGEQLKTAGSALGSIASNGSQIEEMLLIFRSYRAIESPV